VRQKFVIAALACCCLSSTLFWFDATRGSVLHKLDKLCAVQFVVVVGFVTAFPGSSGRALTTGVGVFLPCAMVVLFLLGDLCFKRNMYELQLWFHLLFRYVGYWWGHLLLVPVEKNFASVFVSMSIGYFGHIVCFNELARRKTLFMTQDLYWSSCAVLTLWIFICGQVHSLISYGVDATREWTSIRESVVWLSYGAGLLAAVISALQQPAVDAFRALHAYSEEIVADKGRIDTMVTRGLITVDEAAALKIDLDKRLKCRKDVFWKEKNINLLGREGFSTEGEVAEHEDGTEDN
jgi:hypothetical protein